MRVFGSAETPSMAPLWRRVRELRALVTARPLQKAQERASASSWRPKAPSIDGKRYFSATSYLAAVSGGSIPRNSSSAVTKALEDSADLSEFELLDVLGHGTFGTVKLARHLDSGASVAVKVLAKEVIRDLKQEKNILREQTVHLQLDHPFISRLFATFQDSHALYFVVEFCPGGEVYSLVYTHDDGHLEEDEEDEDDEDDAEKKPPQPPRQPQHEEDPEVSDTVTTDSESDEEQTRQQTASQRRSTMSRRSSVVTRRRGGSSRGRHSLSLENFLAKQTLRSSHGGLHERFAVFYAACLVSALAYLHDRNILYRDLKLENLVLDVDGYPKLIDFGLSKPDALRKQRNHSDLRNTTMCGSMEYMAPEILQHQPYDQRVDLWAFGVILYELLFGATPFYHPNQREQGRRIISEAVEFPEGYEERHLSVCALIRSLLAKDPTQRPASFAEVRKSTFFRSYFPTAQTWQQLESRRITAPFVPKLNGPFDTSLFVRVHEEEDDCSDSDGDSDFGY